jgi:hypothetical protein
VTAPFIAEAERLGIEAVGNLRMEHLLSPADAERVVEHAVAAVVPFLAEHFARVVEAERARIHAEYERGLFRYGDAVEPGSRDPFAEAAMDALDTAARVIRREAATPTEGTQTDDGADGSTPAARSGGESPQGEQGSAPAPSSPPTERGDAFQSFGFDR